MYNNHNALDYPITVVSPTVTQRIVHLQCFKIHVLLAIDLQINACMQIAICYISLMVETQSTAALQPREIRKKKYCEKTNAFWNAGP